jgi:RNA polymerase sigma-70 factor, ECF subfamily
VGDQLDEAELVRRALDGESDAYRTIVETYTQLAFRTAYLITGSSADAEEVTQEAFIRAHRALPRFSRGRPLRPWLMTIVANEARNRRRSNEQRLTLPLAPDFEGSGDAAPSPEMPVLAADRRAHIGEALQRLSPNDRDVIVCRFYLELSEQETASVLGIRRGTVKSRLSRALERLRADIGDPGEVIG